MQDFQQSQGKIMPLFRQAGPVLDPVLLDLLGYWEHLRAGRIAPLRSEIDPREIRGALDFTFILEHTKLGEFRFRVAGSKLCNMMGMELRGMPAYTLIAPDNRDEFSQVLNDMLTTPKISHLQLGNQPVGFGLQKAQMLLLPLRNNTKQVNRFLGCISPRDARIKPPCRFTIDGLKATRIIASQSSKWNSVASGFTEPPARLTPRPEPTSKPGLRGIEGGNQLDRARMHKARPNLRLVTNR